MDAPKYDKKTAAISSEAQFELLDTKTGTRKFLTLDQLKDLNKHECLKNHQARQLEGAKDWRKVNAITGDSSYANPKTTARKDICTSTSVIQTVAEPIDPMPWKVVIAFLILLLLVPAFLIISASNSSGQDETLKTSPPLSAIEQVKDEPKKIPSEKVVFTELEEQIHGFILSTWDEYQKKFSFEKAQAWALIEASREFNKTVFEVARIYDKIDLHDAGLSSDDAENDFANSERFREIGFYQSGDKWLFEDKPVNMGVQLPMPASLKPKAPEVGSKIEVAVKTTPEVTELKALIIKGSVNLPDKTTLMIHIECEAHNYNAQSKTEVIDGTFQAGPFSDGKRLYSRLKGGVYRINISTPTVGVMHHSVKELLGDGGRNIVGGLVFHDPFLGNMVKYSETLVIE